jgi:hypothetical protein
LILAGVKNLNRFEDMNIIFDMAESLNQYTFDDIFNMEYSLVFMYQEHKRIKGEVVSKYKQIKQK